MKYIQDEHNKFIRVSKEDALILKLKDYSTIIYTEAQKKAVESYNTIDYPTIECWYEKYVDSDYVGVWQESLILCPRLEHSDKDIVRTGRGSIVPPYIISQKRKEMVRRISGIIW